MSNLPTLPLHRDRYLGYDLAHDLGIVTNVDEYEQLEQAAVNVAATTADDTSTATVSFADASQWIDWFGDHPEPAPVVNDVDKTDVLERAAETRARRGRVTALVIADWLSLALSLTALLSLGAMAVSSWQPSMGMWAGMLGGWTLHVGAVHPAVKIG